MPKTIVITSQKGGVSKTTTATSLAHAFARQGRNSLIVDFDPQGQSATILGMSPEPGVFNILLGTSPVPGQFIRQTGRDNLYLLPGDRSTATAQIVLGVEARPMNAIAQSLKPLVRDYHYVFFDTAPSVGGIQERAIWAADYVLIPVATEYLSVESLCQTLSTLKMLSDQHGWKGSLLGILPTFYDTITRESRNAMNYLNKHYPEMLLPPIHRATILRECAADGQTIWEKAPDSQSAQDYAGLVKAIQKAG
jgi:chromosome partitioning protein